MEGKDIIVYQANPLVEGIKYNNLEENRLFLVCLQKLVPHLPNSKFYDEDFQEITIPTEELIELFGNDVYYGRLKEISEKMLGKYIFIEDKKFKKFVGYTVFAKIEFDSKKGGLIYEFSKYMKPWLLELYKIGYTRENLREVFRLSSNYGLRILEMLLQYRGCAKDNIVNRTFSIERLRKVLQVPEGAYAKPSVFLPFVIKKPVAEINLKTRYKITFQPVRTGRKTTAVDFFMILPEDDAPPARLETLVPKHYHGIYYSLEKLGVTENVITGWMRSETREILNFIEELAGREDMTAQKLVGGMKRRGWVRREFEKRLLESRKQEEQKKFREELRDDILRDSRVARK